MARKISSFQIVSAGKSKKHLPLLKLTENQLDSTNLEMGDISNNYNREELEKIFKKVMTGLTSGSELTKSEYYMMLTTLLHQHKSIKFDQIEEYIENVSKNTEDVVPKKDVKFMKDYDLLMGKLLAYGSLVRSGAFFSYSQAQQKKIVEKMLFYRKKESRFSLAASIFFTDIIDKIDENTFLKLVWPIMKTEICLPWSAQNIDTLYLLFISKRKYPELINGNIMLNYNIIAAEDVQHLCRILLENPSNYQLKHPAYKIVSEEIAKSMALVYFVYQMDEKLKNLDPFRFLAVLIILTNVLEHLDDYSLLPDLLQHNFVIHLQHYCRSFGQYANDPEVVEKVNEFARTFVKASENREVSDKVKLDCLKKLLFYPGNLFIEENLSGKIIQGITNSMQVYGVKQIAEVYKNILIGSIKKEIENKFVEWNTEEKMQAMNFFFVLTQHPIVKLDFEWKTDQLKFLGHRGFIIHHSTQNVDSKLAEYFRKKFASCLTNLFFSQLDQLQLVLDPIYRHFHVYLSTYDHLFILRQKIKEDSFEMWKLTINFVDILKSKTEPANLLFKSLLQLLSFNLLAGSNCARAALQELFLAYRKFRSFSSKKILLNNDEKSFFWVNELLILLFNLLTYDCDYVKKCVHLIGPHISTFFTCLNIQQILSVIDVGYEDCFLDLNFRETDENLNVTQLDAVNKIIEEATKSGEYEAYRNAAKNIFANMNLEKPLSEDVPRKVLELKEFSLNILNSYLDQRPTVNSCLEIMVSLVDTLELYGKNQQFMFQKHLKSCFKKLTSLKKFSTNDQLTNTELNNMLKALLQKSIESNINQEIKSYLVKACIFVIKCSSVITSSDEAPEIAKKKLSQKLVKTLYSYIELFFKTKEVQHLYTLLKRLLQLKWSGVPYLAQNLFVFVFKPNLSLYKKNMALQLLSVFYKNYYLLSESKFKIQKTLHDDEVQFSNNVQKIFKQLCSKPNQYKEKYVSNIFRLLTAIKTSPLDTGHFNWDTLSELIQHYRTMVIFSRDARAAYNHLIENLFVTKNLSPNNISSSSDFSLKEYLKKTQSINLETLIQRLNSSSKRFTKSINAKNKKNQNHLKDNIEKNIVKTDVTLQEEKTSEEITNNLIPAIISKKKFAENKTPNLIPEKSSGNKVIEVPLLKEKKIETSERDAVKLKEESQTVSSVEKKNSKDISAEKNIPIKKPSKDETAIVNNLKVTAIKDNKKPTKKVQKDLVALIQKGEKDLSLGQDMEKKAIGTVALKRKIYLNKKNSNKYLYVINHKQNTTTSHNKPKKKSEDTFIILKSPPINKQNIKVTEFTEKLLGEKNKKGLSLTGSLKTETNEKRTKIISQSPKSSKDGAKQKNNAEETQKISDKLKVKKSSNNHNLLLEMRKTKMGKR